MSDDSGLSVVGGFDPNDSGDPDGDLATLAALAGYPSDMSKATHFIHFLNFPEEDQAWAAGEELAEHRGVRTRGFGPDEDESDWSVWAETEEVPTIDNVRRMRQVMVEVAERHAGSYDGWEAAVQS